MTDDRGERIMRARDLANNMAKAIELMPDAMRKQWAKERE